MDRYQKFQKFILSLINEKYNTSFVFEKNDFLPYIVTEFKIHGVEDADSFFQIENLDSPIVQGKILFLHNIHYNNFYYSLESSLSVIDIFYQLHLAIQETGDDHHRYLENIFIYTEKDGTIVVETSCGS